MLQEQPLVLGESAAIDSRPADECPKDSTECWNLRHRLMTTPSRDQVLAASAGWVAVLLNVVPGLGAGYLYQRRWRA